jgi:hypothetical protein
MITKRTKVSIANLYKTKQNNLIVIDGIIMSDAMLPFMMPENVQIQSNFASFTFDNAQEKKIELATLYEQHLWYKQNYPTNK